MGVSAPPPPPFTSLQSINQSLTQRGKTDTEKDKKEVISHVFQLFKDIMVLWVEGPLFVDLYDIF